MPRLDQSRAVSLSLEIRVTILILMGSQGPCSLLACSMV
jgi:hypothetical protein